MARARSPRRSLLVSSACLLVALAGVWVLARRTAPAVGGPTPAALAPPVAEESLPPVALGPRAAVPSPEESGLPHTGLPLRLLATVVREDAARSLATIVDLQRSAAEVLSEGQGFAGHPGARIARIERGRVLIDNAGVREQLVILGAPAGPEGAAYELAPEERERRRDLSQRLRALTDAGTNHRELRGRGERGGLLAEGDASAVYEDGEMIGVQFDAIRPGGLYDKLGLRNGDVVKDINGIPLGDPDAARKVIAQLAGSDPLVVEVESGDGSEKTLTIPTSELIGSLVGYSSNN